MLTRRSALFLLAAPAIVRAASLMPVRALSPSPWTLYLGGTEFFVDPHSIKLPGEQLGTRDKPWATLQQAIDYLAVRGIGEQQVTINLAIANHEIEPSYIALPLRPIE
jgi:hypothetical protein